MAQGSSKVAQKALEILDWDRDQKLLRIDNYIQGIHDDPYMPETADAEYKLLAKRSITNQMPLLIGTVSQACYVDGFRRGSDGSSGDTARIDSTKTPQWDFWQRSRFDARQATVYRGAIGFGHYFVLLEEDRRHPGKAVGKILSALDTVALFEDPQNDEDPSVVLTVTKRASSNGGRGLGRMWDDTWEYKVTWGTGFEGVRATKVRKHGFEECPVTRFAPWVDGEGRTTGIVWPHIPYQNRLNQTIFDLLIGQTFTSFNVRYATGMAPPMEMEVEYDDDGVTVIGIKPKIGPDGQPIPKKMDYNARRFLFAEDHEANFGSLPGSPLSGFIEAADLAVRHLASSAQIPPHHLLGQIANLSAEALAAAETALMRKVQEVRQAFGESWERVFRLAMAFEGQEGAEDYHGEVIWRDMESKSLAMTADALGKLKEQLEIPAPGLWSKIPGVTQNEIDDWRDWWEEQQEAMKLANALMPSSTRRQTNTRGNLTPASPGMEG